MAKRKKLVIKLPREDTSPAIVIDYAKAVYSGMSTNAATFPAPPVSMESLKKAIDDAEAAKVPEADRSANTDLELEKQIGVIYSMMGQLSIYVLFVANNDRYIGGLSGFEFNKEETTSHTPSVFSAKFVSPGPNPGTAIVRIEERAGNAFFLVQVQIEGKWVIIDGFNELLFTVEGLPPGQSILRIYGKKGKKKSPAVEIVVRAS